MKSLSCIGITPTLTGLLFIEYSEVVERVPFVSGIANLLFRDRVATEFGFDLLRSLTGPHGSMYICNQLPSYIFAYYIYIFFFTYTYID